MFSRCAALCLAAGFLLFSAGAEAREWADESGKYFIEAELVAFNDEFVVLKRADGELGVLAKAELSESDREYLDSDEAQEINEKNLLGGQTWTTTSGMELAGRVVDYARVEVTIQRRRGRMYVNDRVFGNLPELYQKLLPEVIAHFEGVEIPDARAMQNWLLSLRGQPRTFVVDGVLFEMENGDEYGIPFFVFSEADRKILKAGWSQWLASQQSDDDQADDHAFRLEAFAASYLQNQKINRQIALMNLNLQAIRAGVTSAWEVTLFPRPGNPSPPRWVVTLGRDSSFATAAALRDNPGFFAGPVRRLSR